MLRAHLYRAFGRAGVALLLGVLIALTVASADARSGRPGSPWQSVMFPSQLHPGAMLLLTTGAVMVQNQGAGGGGASGWWLLTPSADGSYVNGTWRSTRVFALRIRPCEFRVRRAS